MLNRRDKSLPDTAPPSTKPTLASVAPRYVELKQRWDELCQREDELTARLRPIVARVAQAGGYNTAAVMPNMQPPPPPAKYPAGIGRLIGDVLPFKRPDAPQPNEIVALRAQAAGLSDELSDIADAKAVLWPELRKATFAGSAELIEALAPEYSAIARRIVDALIELGGALADQQSFVRDIERQGATVQTLRQIRMDHDGADQFSRIAIALRSAVAHGHVAASEISPEILLK